MTKQELLNKLQSSEELIKMAYLPLHEVINWVKELEEAPINDDIISDIVDEIVGEEMDLIDDYELSMSYREVELDSVSIDGERIERAIRRALNKQ